MIINKINFGPTFNILNMAIKSDVNISDRIRLVLTHLDVTAVMLAKEIGVPASTLNSYINEQREPSALFFIKLKKRYSQINLNWLITGEGAIDKEYDRQYEDLKERYFIAMQDQLTLYKRLLQYEDADKAPFA